MSTLNSEQLQYVNTLKKDHPGLDTEEIRSSLVGAEWSIPEIEEALSLYRGTPVVPQVPVPPTPPVAPVVPAQSSATTPVVVKTEAKPSSPSNTPTIEVTAITAPKSHFGIWILAVLILLAAGGAGAYYVITQTDLFGAPKLTNEQLLQNIFTKLGEIETTHYSFDIGLNVGDREAGATAFAEGEVVSEEELMKYKRDQDRIRDIVAIKQVLQSQMYENYDNEKPLYPKNLESINSKITDPLGKAYEYTQIDSGADYSLAVTFETLDAATVIRSGLYGESSDTNANTGNTITLTASDYIYEGSFTGKPTQPKLMGLFDVASMESSLPDNLDIKFHMGGTVDTTTDKPVNAKLEMSGEASFGDATFAFGAEGIKKEDTYYGIITKMPTFFSEMSKLRGKWVRVTEADIADYGYESYFAQLVPTKKSDRENKITEMQNNFKTMLQIADRRGLVSIGEGPEKVTLEGEKLNRYSLNLAYDNLLPFYEELVVAFASSSNEVQRDEIFVEYLKSEDAEKIFAYLKENMTIELYTNKEGFPARIVLSMRYVPSQNADALKDKQLNLIFTFSFKDINKPVEVTAPETSISFDELMSDMTGMSKEEILLQRQEANIKNVRGALSSYFEWTGQYPESLDELTQTRSEVAQQSTGLEEDPFMFGNSGYLDSYIDSIPFIAAVPKDVYTKSDFAYTKGSNDYELTYTAELVPFTINRNPANYYSYYYPPVEERALDPLYDYTSWDYGSSTLVLKFSNGENTATKDALSAVSLDTTDTDGDTLADPLETVLTTDPRNKDTDNDGVTDSDEISSGSNPIGPGRLEFSSGYFSF